MSKNEEKNSKSKTSIKKNILQEINIHKLSNARIIQRHLVYIVGLSSFLANKEVLNYINPSRY